jgi:DnaJ-class molecular chaperone
VTLSSEHPEFKTCPNCGGDGYENNPPMRKCGVCKGKGRLPYPVPLLHDDHQEKRPSGVAEKACTAGQGA